MNAEMNAYQEKFEPCVREELYQTQATMCQKYFLFEDPIDNPRFLLFLDIIANYTKRCHGTLGLQGKLETSHAHIS